MNKLCPLISTLISPILLASPTAIPEPPAILYGTINPPTSIEWQVTSPDESATINTTRLVTIENQTYYISQIPFETRELADGTRLPATPNTLEQTRTDTTYTRSATINGKPATLPPGKQTFTYGIPSMGLVERIDLIVGETYAEWALRTLGSATADRTADNDGDGQSNYDEYIAGTDPNDPNSNNSPTEFLPTPGGGYTIRWDTKVGKRYTLLKSTSLTPEDWLPIVEAAPGTGQQMHHTEPPSPTASPRTFFQLLVSDPLIED